MAISKKTEKHYFAWRMNVKRLPKEEMESLLDRSRCSGEDALEARNELAVRFIPLVLRVAGRISGRIEPDTYDDLVSVGVQVLIRAIQLYGSGGRSDASFSTYAYRSLDYELRGMLFERNGTFHIPHYILEGITKLRRADLDERSEVSEVCQKLCVSPSRAQFLLHGMKIHRGTPESIDDFAWGNEPACSADNFRAIDAADSVKVALAALNKKERFVVRERHFSSLTFREIETKGKLGIHTASYIYHCALKKMREALCDEEEGGVRCSA